MSEVLELIEQEGAAYAATLVDAHVDQPGKYQWPDKGGVWSAVYDDDGGKFEQGMELDIDGTSVEYQYVSERGMVETACLGDGVVFTTHSGHAVSFFVDSIFAEDADLLEVLGGLVWGGVVQIDAAISAVEEDESYDEQDLVMFKVKFS